MTSVCRWYIYMIMTSNELKAWRKENSYSQSQLAKVLDVATMTVSRWETGLREIPSFLHLALECLKTKGGELKKAKGTKTKTKKKKKGGTDGKSKRNL